MTQAVLDELVKVIDQRALKAGFVRQDADGLLLWASQYARILLSPVDDIQAKDLTSHAASERIRLDKVLEQLGETPAVCDGYLILALLTEPALNDKRLRTDIRAAELNTSICRQHVVWPDADGVWARLETVTVLEPPQAGRVQEAAAWPDFSADEWAMLKELQSATAAGLARQDAQEVAP